MMTVDKDKLYIQALQQNDYQGVRKIYEDFSGGILDWIKNNSGTAKDAEDVFNEALIAIFEKVKKDDFRLTYPFGKWLFGICRNKWIDKLNKKKREAEVIKSMPKGYDIESDLQTQLEQIETESLRQKKLDTAFAKLSELCQKLLLLAKEGLKPTEIAHQLDMTNQNTVYRRKKACIDRWRTLFHEL